jgi:hypothetical protein
MGWGFEEMRVGGSVAGWGRSDFLGSSQVRREGEGDGG